MTRHRLNPPPSLQAEERVKPRGVRTPADAGSASRLMPNGPPHRETGGMDLSALITRGFAMSDRALWLLMVERGACSVSELSPDDWYPVSASAEAARCEAAGAIAVCTACPVRQECLELALRNWGVGQHGVWGGTVPAERERLRAARVAQLTRVLARNRGADRAASRDADRAASLSPLHGGRMLERMTALPFRPPWRSFSSTCPAASRSTVEPMRAVIAPSASICPTVVSP